MKIDCNDVRYTKYSDIMSFLHMKQEELYSNPTKSRWFYNSFFPTYGGKAWERMLHAFSIARTKRINQLINLDVVVTGRCVCNCWHCFRNDFNHEELSLEKIQDIFQQASSMGVATIGITGGEPMVRDDILEIISLIPDDMEGVLYTTGHKITPEFVKRIRNSNLTRCVISLDHYLEEEVVKKRNNPLIYEETLSAIRALSNSDIYTAVTLCLTEDLLDDQILDKYYEFVKNLGVNEIRISLPVSRGKLANKDVKQLYLEGPLVIERLRERHQENDINIFIFNELESGAFIGCNAGSMYLSINNNGDVNPCVAVTMPFGNVYEESISSIYKRMAPYFHLPCKICYGKLENSVERRMNSELEGLNCTETEKSYIIANECLKYKIGTSAILR